MNYSFEWLPKSSRFQGRPRRLVEEGLKDAREKDEGDGWVQSTVQNLRMEIDNIYYLYRLMIFAFFSSWRYNRFEIDLIE